MALRSTIEFDAFFDRYQRFQQQDHDDFAAYVLRVRPELEQLQKAIRFEALNTSPHFNVFRLLKVVHKEAEFHTPFLGHLLDPQASHGQGLLFLKCLFDCWKGRIAPPDGSLDDGRWLVRTEFHTPETGRLDLLIENFKKKYVLVIENKIDCHDHADSPDRDDQLIRYRKWMDRHRTDCKGQLVYLTPNGRHPQSSTCRKCLSGDQDARACVPQLPGRCTRLSYNSDVRRFLESTRERIKADPVRSIVAQYLACLDDLMEEYDDECGNEVG